jgi:glycosyltransferase involved in cell wall biosynthesis
MFRPGVKTRGILKVIQSCGKLAREGKKVRLVIAGDGHSREELEVAARKILPGKVIFCGKIPRKEMYRYYSAADIFAFPGIEESLGMVYLEAQCCGLPVIAYENWGGREAVLHNRTGLLSPAEQPDNFTHNINTLIDNGNIRQQMGREAAQHIRNHHELHRGYNLLREKIAVIQKKYRGKPTPACSNI